MIKGITKPFELGGVQLPPEQLRAAAAAYLVGMDDLFERFGDSDMLDLTVSLEGEDESIPFVVRRILGVTAVAPNAQIHLWHTDIDGTVRRHDSREIGLRMPNRERTLPVGASALDGLRDLQRRVAEEAALGINDQPVDEEEVNNLFGLLQRATRSGQ